MSQTKIDQYKKEKANRKANAKKARARKRLTTVLSVAAGVIVVGFLVVGIVLTIKNGGLKSIVDKKEQAYQNYQIEQEFVNFMNSAAEDSGVEDTDTDTTKETE